MANTKKRILALFANGKKPSQVLSGLTDSDLVGLLDGLASPLPLANKAEGALLSQFLYAGASRFDRWFVPSPYVVPPTHSERFKKFVKALWRSENFSPENCATFQLHVVRDLMFKDLSDRPLADISSEQIQEFRRRIRDVQAPARDPKWGEFKEHQTVIVALLDGIADGSLRTRISTRIPYLIAKQSSEVKLCWRGLAMVVRLKPEYRSTEESMIGTGNGVMVSVGASRWQTGVTHIDIDIEALVDGSAYTEGLQAIPGHRVPVEGWPKAFTLGFGVIRDLVWHLREKHEGLQDWIPAPRDLADVEYFMQTSTSPRLGYIRRGSPAALQQMFVAPDDVVRLEIGELTPLSWFAECRLRAGMYLELGDTNEALFWLNVAVEALIMERFGRIEAVAGIAGLAEQLGSPREFWAQAEEIVAQQFPHMAGEVKWPSAPLHVSVFGKLKVLYRKVKMQTPLDELLSRYKKISGNRNDLFHGKSTERTPVQDILNAMEALSWIDDNMWPDA